MSRFETRVDLIVYVGNHWHQLTPEHRAILFGLVKANDGCIARARKGKVEQVGIFTRLILGPEINWPPIQDFAERLPHFEQASGPTEMGVTPQVPEVSEDESGTAVPSAPEASKLPKVPDVADERHAYVDTSSAVVEPHRQEIFVSSRLVDVLAKHGRLISIRITITYRQEDTKVVVKENGSVQIPVKRLDTRISLIKANNGKPLATSQMEMIQSTLEDWIQEYQKLINFTGWTWVRGSRSNGAKRAEECSAPLAAMNDVPEKRGKHIKMYLSAEAVDYLTQHHSVGWLFQECRLVRGDYPGHHVYVFLRGSLCATLYQESKGPRILEGLSVDSWFSHLDIMDMVCLSVCFEKLDQVVRDEQSKKVNV